jgi:hypothetical protein
MILGRQVFAVAGGGTLMLVLNIESCRVSLAPVRFLLRRCASLHSTGSSVKAGR